MRSIASVPQVSVLAEFLRMQVMACLPVPSGLKRAGAALGGWDTTSSESLFR